MSETDTPKYDYPAPIDKLLTLGDVHKFDSWPDYLALGLTEAHIPDLIRMSLDPELNRADSDAAEVWSPVHAWRALGQLKAEAAVEPLTRLYHEFDDMLGFADVASFELAEVFSMIGPSAAIPVLSAYIKNPAHGDYPRQYAARSLVEIADKHSDFRSQIVAAITEALEKFEDNEPHTNGSFIASLLDLKAVESLPVMERAFQANRVDEMIVGDWDDVQIDFGLKEFDPVADEAKRQARRQKMAETMGLSNLSELFADPLFDEIRAAEEPAMDARAFRRQEQRAQSKKKSKRKQAKKSRQQNRSKKRR